MSIPNWPEALPSFLLRDWSYGKQTSILKSDMEIGPPKRRKRTTAEGGSLTGSIEIDQQQFEVFKTFVESTLSGGINSFLWPDFISGTPKEVVLSIDTKGVLYSVSQTGENTFKIKLKLEVLP